MEDISHIFRSYDIRGIYGADLNEETMGKIGAAFSMFSKTAVVSRDMRLSSPSLTEAFISGFVESGGRATDAGLLPLGVAMFRAWKSKKNLAYVTASHLAKEWNGAKFFHSDGTGFSEKENRRMRDIVVKGTAVRKAKGSIEKISSDEAVSDYVNYLSRKIKPERKMRVAMDFGNGAASIAGMNLFRKCGFDVVPLFENLDGTFPNRNPEPQEDPLDALKETISAKDCDFGIAYDGDGDRMIIIDDAGNKLGAEQTSYVILGELLKKEKGPIVANVECTRLIDYVAGKFGRNVVRIPVGHTFLINSTYKNKACFGVEVAGHYTITSLFPFDDALAISLYAAYALSKHKEPLSGIIEELPKYNFERISIKCDDKKKFAVVKSLKSRLRKNYRKVLTIDGARVDFPYGWVLVRASNTSPLVRLTIEADTHGDLEKLKDEFLGIVEEEISKTDI